MSYLVLSVHFSGFPENTHLVVQIFKS